MGIIKNRHGVYCVRKKVPEKLAVAVALVTASDRPRVSWLQKSLNTKILAEAKVRAKPVLMRFDRILAEAKAREVERPPVSELPDRDITRMAEYHYASRLAEDDEIRTFGTGSEDVYAEVSAQIPDEKLWQGKRPFRDSKPVEFGLTDREMVKREETLAIVLPHMEAALARGDISAAEEHIEELLTIFGRNLDRKSASYRVLGMAVLRQEVAALKAMQRRNTGEPVETPQVSEPTPDAGVESPGGTTLQDALPGWEMATKPAPTTKREFNYAVQRFIELHGNMAITAIHRGHVRRFREALQAVPRKRDSELQKLKLPSLVEWTKANAGTPCISAATVNKLLGGVQAVTIWAAHNGFVADEKQWADPFARMRLEEEEPKREPWEVSELNTLFASDVYLNGWRPDAGGGDAAYWLPLLSLFSGARLGEVAPLYVSDLRTDDETGVLSIWIEEDLTKGKRLKTASSNRMVPLHPELVRLGFMDYVNGIREKEGDDVRLFPLVAPGSRGIIGEAWSKWFGRYIRSIGITNPARVFHSFRHNFKDALRAAGIGEDLNDVLTGHSGGGVGRGYGAKDKARRFGHKRLADAVAAAQYKGLDLSALSRQPRSG